MVLGAIFLLACSACFAPLQVSWDKNQPLVGPQGPAPQGRLTIYSERYEPDDEEDLSTYRRIVFLYNEAGQFLGRYSSYSSAGDPVQVLLAPGHYIVVSRANGRLRKVQVDIEEGKETLVPEKQIKRSPVASSS
jgi:hypothetical protein